jgi:hypothetical protein
MHLQPISPAATPWISGALTEGMSGLGAEPVKIVQTAGNIANAAVPVAMGISHATVFGVSAAMSATIIGAAVAGVTLALMALFSRKGGKQKAATTGMVDQAVKAMQDNLAGYIAGPHTVSSQAQALANFDAAWQFVVESCGQETMGDPGQRCILERMPAAQCDYAYSHPNAVVPWWTPDLNNVLSRSECGKWDMAKDNRDPIANDPHVVPDPSITGDIGAAAEGLISSVSGGGLGALLLAGGLIFVALSMGGNK